MYPPPHMTYDTSTTLSYVRCSEDPSPFLQCSYDSMYPPPHMTYDSYVQSSEDPSPFLQCSPYTTPKSTPKHRLDVPPEAPTDLFSAHSAQPPQRRALSGEKGQEGHDNYSDVTDVKGQMGSVAGEGGGGEDGLLVLHLPQPLQAFASTNAHSVALNAHSVALNAGMAAQGTYSTQGTHSISTATQGTNSVAAQGTHSTTKKGTHSISREHTRGRDPVRAFVPKGLAKSGRTSSADNADSHIKGNVYIIVAKCVVKCVVKFAYVSKVCIKVCAWSADNVER